MGGRKLLFLLVIGAGIAALFVLNSELRAKVGGLVGGVKEEFGPGEASDTIGHDVKVFVPRGDQFYHTRDCPRTQGTSAVPTPLSRARVVCKPCPECNPPH